MIPGEHLPSNAQLLMTLCLDGMAIVLPYLQRLSIMARCLVDAY
jgi:hypothetical protein